MTNRRGNSDGASERVLADDFSDFNLVVLVPPLATETLGQAVADIFAPAFQRLLVLPPHDRQPLAVVRLERFDVDEARHGPGEIFHLGSHRIVAVWSIYQLRAKEHDHHARHYSDAYDHRLTTDY